MHEYPDHLSADQDIRVRHPLSATALNTHIQSTNSAQSSHAIPRDHGCNGSAIALDGG